MTSTLSQVPAFGPFLPELVLAVVALVLVLIGAFRGDGSKSLIDWVAIAALVVAGLLVIEQGPGTLKTFNDAFIADAFARYMKVLTLIGSVAAIVLSMGYLKDEKVPRFEYALLVLLSTLGMMVMISANELISLYLGLELQSLALYVLAAIHRDNTRASEAGLKYFVLGALSSGMLLYGMSLVYGYTGSISFQAIAASVHGGHNTGVTFGLVFILAGLAFKISAVPFHMWTPDVYEGAPTPVTAFFATAPKMAAVAILVRLLVSAFPAVTRDWQQIVTFMAIASMALGAFAAIPQTNIKRLMAYSSIANMGYGLVGLASGSIQGVEGIAIFMAIYLAMTLGAFAVILSLKTDKGRVEGIEDLAGLSKSHPFMAAMLMLIMFSLIGIPPLAGFFGKFYVFAAAIKANLMALAVLGILTSVVSAYYYLRIVKVMYFDEPKGSFLPVGAEVKFVMTVASLVVLLFWVYPAPIKNAAEAAAKSLF
jgi:NADH-quinone oxidoreductase subunit N